MSVINFLPKRNIVTPDARVEYEMMRMAFEKAAQERQVFQASLDYEMTCAGTVYKDDRVQACWLFWQAGEES